MNIVINGHRHVLPAEWAGVRLLDALREHLGLTGTKYGCGIGVCGACTVHLDGEAARSCQVTVEEAAAHRVTTIEGLAETAAGRDLHPVQDAWIAEGVPQCGYCQAGQIMAAAALLAHTPHPSSAEIRAEMSGNLCRCGTYPRILRAIRRAANDGGDHVRN